MMRYEDLFKSLDSFKIKGVGPKTLELLKPLKIDTLFNLLYSFPKYYEDRTRVSKISDLVPNFVSTISGEVVSANIISTRKGKLFKALLRDETGLSELVWFKMPYLRSTIKKGIKVNITGKVMPGNKFINPEYSFGESSEIKPVYALTRGLPQSKRRAIAKEALSFAQYFIEIIPEHILKKYDVLSRQEALREIHFPSNNAKLERAKARFAIEELLLLQFAILKRKYMHGLEKSNYSITDNKELVRRYLKMLPFDLTKAQKKVITEIYREIKEGKLVNRLIQGDVGSGKSVVIFILMLYMISNGYQAAVMAPTEVLAEQHYLSLKDDFVSLGLKVGLLTSSKKESEKKRLIDSLNSGDIDLLVGTHSLIYDRVVFDNLGLIVIDEQHKFGVDQRRKIKDKCSITNVISMSATPIPRSLALTIYGDLDVSIIDELPSGRKKVKTSIVNNLQFSNMCEDIKSRINSGEQCYFVAPLIEDSEKIESRSAYSVYDELREKYFKEYSISLLHGKLSSEEKEAVLSEFRDGKTDIIVSTTVIEVGVNVPNATTMVVLDANRFGLSQLHQLRGRVGRGSKQSYCYLVDPKGDCSRLKILAKTSDGFEIAEADLEIRKAGEILGTLQSGSTDSHLTELLKDIKTIKLAREEAINYLKENNFNLSDAISLELKKRFEEKSIMN